MGPEQGISVLENELKGVKWDGTGVGYGVRGSRRQDLTIRLEGMTLIHHEKKCWYKTNQTDPRHS